MCLISGQMRAGTTKRIRKSEFVGGGLGFVDGPLASEGISCLLLKASGVGIQ